METLNELLKSLNACEPALEWVEDMTIEEAVEKCHRGDWLLWLAAITSVNKRKLTLAKGYCAKTVIHLMRDQRSVEAVNTAIRYGRHKADDSELQDAAYAAADAAADAAYAAADAAAYAAAAADAAAYAAADAAYAAYAAAYAADAKKQNQNETADICRKYLGKDIIKKVNQLLEKS